MNHPMTRHLCLLAAAVLLFSGCSSSQPMVISQVDYSQPIESVITPGEEGIVTDRRYAVEFSILPVQLMETGDTTEVTTREIRLIRSGEGYYFLTAPGYRHVYVFSPEESGLRLERQILISEEGIGQPAFNQREGQIQLLSRDAGQSWLLTADGIVHSETMEEE